MEVRCVFGSVAGRFPWASSALLDGLDEEFGPSNVGLSLGLAGLSMRGGLKALKSYCAGNSENGEKAGRRTTREYFDLGPERLLVAELGEAMVPVSDDTKTSQDLLVVVGGNQENVQMKVKEYFEMALDIVDANWILSPHEPILDYSSRKVRDRAVLRTQKWAEQGLKSLAGNETFNGKFLFPVIGTSLEDALNFAHAMLEVAGSSWSEQYGLYFNTLSETEPSVRTEIVSGVLQVLRAKFPEAKDVTVLANMGSASKRELGQIITAGANAIYSTLNIVETTMGRALTDTGNINLRNQDFARDERPLLPGCKCWVCKNHTRSYFYHLVISREMLAEMLLYTHNTHQLLDFAKQTSRKS